MAGVQDFVAGLALAGKGVKEDQKTVKVAIGDQALKKTQIKYIFKLVNTGKFTADCRHLNSQNAKRTSSLIADVAAAIQDDARVTVDDLVVAFGVSYGNIHTNSS